MVVNHDQPTLDQLQVCFDDHHAVANAGLLLPATLAERLGIQAATDELVRLGGSAGARGRQAADRGPRHARRRLHRRPRRALRCHRRPGPSAWPSWAIGSWPPRPWGRCPRLPMPGDPRSTPPTSDVGYHPRYTSGHRRGPPRPPARRPRQHRPRHARFIDELIARTRRAGATGELTFRADSGLVGQTIKCLRRHGVRYSITVRQTKPVRHAIAQIPEPAWTDICYPDTGVAQVAETRLKGDRLIVRQVHCLKPKPSCSPPGSTTRSSTAPAPPSGWTPTTAATPQSNWPSGT